jgi:hypothetical protein
MESKYSLSYSGILVAVVGALIAQFGFSESCSSELMAKLSPVIGMIPGAILSMIGRYRLGGVTPLGFKKGY